MSEDTPAADAQPTPEQATVESAAPAPDQAAAPAVDESAQDSPAPAEPAASAPAEPAASADVAPAAAPDPVLQEMEDLRSRYLALEQENQHLKEQLALHAASTAPDAFAALKQIAALAAPFA